MQRKASIGNSSRFFSLFVEQGGFFYSYMFHQFLVTGQPNGSNGLCLSLLFLSAQLQNPRGDLLVVLWHTGKARGKSIIIGSPVTPLRQCPLHQSSLLLDLAV